MKSPVTSLLMLSVLLVQLLGSIPPTAAQPFAAAPSAPAALPADIHLVLPIAEETAPWLPPRNAPPAPDLAPAGPPPAAQATWTVNATDDTSDGTCDVTHCSLREAVNLSTSGDTIVFDQALAGATITLTNGQLYIYGDLTIDASALGEERVTISGNNASDVFYHPFTTTLVLNNLRIIDGFDDTWAGCIFSDGDLALEDCELVHCVTTANSGGAIFSNNGTLTLIRTRIAESSSGTYGGGVYAGGALLRVSDSTFENNLSPYGAALQSEAGTTTTISGSLFRGNASSGAGTVLVATGTISNSTFSGNQSTGGIIVAQSSDNLTLWNVTVANNEGWGVVNALATLHVIHTLIVHNTPQDCSIIGSLATDIKNLDSDGTCGVEYTAADPLLGPLEDNGGDTWTHALLPGSPAIDAGDNAYCPASDQRGVERPKDGDGDGSAVCDIGAFELTNELDYGDAPSPYPTLEADNGARHYLRAGYHLGGPPDIDADGFPSPGADGDDLNHQDDEDGVAFLTPLRTNDTAVVEVALAHAGYLHAWLDFNADGDWADPGEKFVPGLYRPAGTHRFTFTVPVDSPLGDTYARFRFASRARMSYNGLAVDGEVEDYRVAIQHGRPVARPDTAGLDENSSLLLDVLGNDFDPHGTIALQSVGPAQRGTTAIEDGQVRYTPNPDYSGSDAFYYTIVNDVNLTQTARVSLLIRNVNSRPNGIEILDQQALIAACDAANVCTLPPDTLVGTLRALDPDPGDTHIFNLLDSGEFRLSGAVLYTRQPIVFTGSTQTIQKVVNVRATDAGNLSFDKAFTLFILGDRVPGGPEAILLSNDRVAENLPAGTLVGVLTTQEETPQPPYAYSLVSGVGSNDNARFQIVGDQLRTAAPLDFEQKELLKVRVRTLNGVGQFKDALFTIRVLDDTSEPPAPPPNCSGANIELIDSGDVQMRVINVTASNVSLDGCDIEGELVMAIPGWSGSGIAFAGEVDQHNQLTAEAGDIAPIAMQIAGMPLHVARPSLESYDGRPGLRLERASFCLPAEWGGLCAPALAGGVSMLIDDGGLKVGGELKIGFPDIKVGNQLSLSGLSGKLVPVPGGYEITLGGEFGLPKFKPGGAGGCGISASVTVYVGAAGELVMEIHTLPPDGPDAVRLREISVGLSCEVGIPIDNTGLALTGVEGTVTLRPDAQSVSLTLTVTSIARVPGLGLALLRGDGTATLSWEPYWGLDLETIVYLLEVFRVAQTHVGVFENRFSFTAQVNSLYMNGTLRIDAWTDWARLHLAGRGQVDVGFREGSIYHGCIDFGLFDICISIPPFDLSVGLGAEFGEFTNNRWGAKGYVEVLGKQYGIYIDARPSLHVGGVDQYQLVTPPQVLAALAQWRAAQEAGAGLPPPAGDLYATAADRVVLRVPVNMEPPAILPTGQITQPVELQTRKDTLFALSSSEPLTMTLQTPDGTVITPDNYDQPPVFPTYTVQYTQVAYYQVDVAEEYTLSTEPRLHFVPAATHPAWAEVDLILDGVLLFAHQRLDAAEPLYIPIYAGDHLLAVGPSAGGTVVTATFSAAADTDYTVLLSGDGAAPDLSVLTDDNGAPSPGQARVRFVHSAPYTGAVDVFFDGSPVLDDAAYPSASPYLERAPGEVLVEIKDATSGEDVAPPQVVNLAPGGVHTLFDFVHPAEAYSLAWASFLDQGYIERHYAQFIVSLAPTGTWEVALEGNLDTALPMFAALGVANPPAVAYVEAHATDPFQAELQWQLWSDYLPTRVEVYANPGEYMDPAWVFQGYRVAELELTDPEDVAGSPFTYTVDLSGLESGEYTLWVRADDGVNPPASAYALTGPYGDVAVFTISQSATFPISWTPAITAVVDSAQARLFLEWENLAHPDVDHYNLYVSTEPLSPTLHSEGLAAFRRTDEDGQPFGPVLVDAGVSNLEPGETYYYSVEAVDVEGGRSVRSPEAAITIAGGDFRLSAPSLQYLVDPGAQVSFPLSLEVLEALFYPNVGLSIDTSETPPGMRVYFDSPLGGDAYLTETAGVTVVVDLLDTVAKGIYPITFVGTNGELEHSLTIYILANPEPADLAIAGEYELGDQEQVTFTIVVSNLGPGPADGATVAIPFPPEISQVAWACAGTGDVTCGSGTGDVLDAIGDFAAGDVATYTITGIYLRYRPFRVTATVSWMGPDDNLDNNSISLVRPVAIVLPFVYKHQLLGGLSLPNRRPVE